jgi:chaperonin GroEL
VRLKVGAHTDSEQKQRQAQAERVVRMVTQAARYGVVDGAGAALVRAEKPVRAYAAEQADADARFGAECLARALSAPAAAIASNAGIDPGAFVARLRACKAGRGIDVVQDKEVDLRAAGILDSAYALDLAVRTAASAAATLLTTDVIVHRRQADAALRP